VRFDIQPSSTEPLYRQIVTQVRRQVASGLWPAGTPLPSVRAVALEHAINPMTVSKAYSLLEAEGLLERRRGMGMVTGGRSGASLAADRLALLEPALQAAAQQAQQLGIGARDALALFDRLLAERGVAQAPHGDDPAGAAASARAADLAST
jgi:GntR family transcriptional regulator